MVLETGIDSLVLKASQYPFQYRSNHTVVKIIDIVLVVCSVLYLLVVGAGILIGYIYLANGSIVRGHHIDPYLSLGEKPITLAQIVLHQFANLIMVVPILLRVLYLLYVNIAGRIISSKLNIRFKDYNMITEIKHSNVLITTIGGDLIKMGTHRQEDLPSENIFEHSQDESKKLVIKNRSLQSVHVGGIHHNFLTTSIHNELYSTKDVDMICYFMSIALLTCSRTTPSPLESAIIERCSKELNINIQKMGKAIKIGQLKVIRLFTIPATEKYPYKIVFYKHAKDEVEDLEKQK